MFNETVNECWVQWRDEDRAEGFAEDMAEVASRMASRKCGARTTDRLSGKPMAPPPGPARPNPRNPAKMQVASSDFPTSIGRDCPVSA